MDDFKIDSLLKSNWKFRQRLKEPFIKAFGNTFGEILKSLGRETLWQDLVSKGTSILDLRNRIVHSVEQITYSQAKKAIDIIDETGLIVSGL